ncbi:hypothetical protein, conserved [Plasmodium gonderi]|uniref:PPR repeat protein n=1 Tax=Plasmodium gonderi TaxID=77519 RepID=A0A1Y1JLQ3_PLAGO|nr:hypothetical protein, conserved [Plasmodium gonderi]GAW83150.1 hypothetical protein, conserved [Plasmodium gonderi]
MKLKYCYYAGYIISNVLCIKVKNNINHISFVNHADNHLVVTRGWEKKRKCISQGSYENNKKKKSKATILTNACRKTLNQLYNKMQDGEAEKQEEQDRKDDINTSEDILKKKRKEKEVEQSIVPLNMDWVKVMNLIYSTKDVDPTTLSFNAAISAVEKKGCLISMLELFEIMKKKNIKPDVVSYKLILSLCDKYHLSEHAEVLFDEMVETDKLTPTYEIYSLMISCFAKVGNGYKAIEFLEKLRNDPFVVEMKSMDTVNDDCNDYDKQGTPHRQGKKNKWEDDFLENDVAKKVAAGGEAAGGEAADKEAAENSNEEKTKYSNQFKEITEKIKNVEKGSSKIQYGEYANVIFACNMSNLPEHGIKYFEELLNTGKYMPSTFVLENIFDLLGKNGNYEKCLEYYSKLKDDPNFKKYINVNILNNILKALSIYNKINIIEDIWKNEFDELSLTPNVISYQYMLKVYSIVDDYENAFKLFKEMQMKKLLNKKNIFPFLYTINAFKNCGIYNYAIYVLRIAKILAISSDDLLMLYNNTMITCINSKKYDVIISLYAELITMQEKASSSLEISINTLGFVLLAFKELKMHEDFTNLKNLIIQKNYKLTPLCSKLVSDTLE